MAIFRISICGTWNIKNTSKSITERSRKFLICSWSGLNTFSTALWSAFSIDLPISKTLMYLRKPKGSLLDSEATATKLIEETAGISERIQSGKSTCEEEFENFLQFAVWGKRLDLTWPRQTSVTFIWSMKRKSPKWLRIPPRRFLSISKLCPARAPGSRSYWTILVLNCWAISVSSRCSTRLAWSRRTARSKFNLKAYPWFVSDGIRSNFTWTLDVFQKSSNPNKLRRTGWRWNDFLNHKKVWELRNPTELARFLTMKRLDWSLTFMKHWANQMWSYFMAILTIGN